MNYINHNYLVLSTVFSYTISDNNSLNSITQINVKTSKINIRFCINAFIYLYYRK